MGTKVSCRKGIATGPPHLRTPGNTWFRLQLGARAAVRVQEDAAGFPLLFSLPCSVHYQHLGHYKSFCAGCTWPSNFIPF